ncbi:maltooligosyl trehalose synthase [Eggerthella sp. YY7918]|nr:maltooligosyl trehalose synthase [Eggerthella sp. YY7918]
MFENLTDGAAKQDESKIGPHGLRYLGLKISDAFPPKRKGIQGGSHYKTMEVLNHGV